ncbi:hypothetical protein Vlu01_22230 [Micromonospora lutea]|uniref:Transposase n=1 Tax=Micromonospora lutea TaxID=419825 RepID=A0ABQ4IUJ5_9ACTN|nr:hypothetical protein Vlu01_22230 [Micromonospora lutea]
MLAGRNRAGRRYDESVLAGILALPTQTRWRADRSVSVDRRLVRDGRAVHLVAVDVVAVDPGGPVGLHLVTDGRRQVGMA